MVKPISCFPKLLSKFKSNDNLTHTRIGDRKNIYGGKYTIGPENEDSFYQSYYKHAFINKNPEYLTEVQIKDGQILIDLDFRYPVDIEERQHTDAHITDIIELYMEEINMLTENITEIFPVFVFQKHDVNRQSEITKDGIHLIFGISMSHNIQLLLRQRILKSIDDVFSDLPLENNYESVLDIGISKGTTNWQLYGSRKPAHEPYVLTNYYQICAIDGNCEMEQIDITKPKNNFIRDLLPMISARNRDVLKVQYKAEIITEATNMSFEKRKYTKKGAKKIKIINQNIINSFNAIENEEDLKKILDDILVDSTENNKYSIKEAHDYTMLLSEKYYDPYAKWIEVGWTLFCIDYCCFPTWIKFSSKSSKFSFGDVSEFLDLWNKMEVKGKTLGSLMYWAKEDNPYEYKKVKDDAISYYINQTLDGSTEYDIAKVLYKMEGENYKCVSVAGGSRKLWYQYANGRWGEIADGSELRQVLSEGLNMEYTKRMIDSKNKVVSVPTNGEEESHIMQQCSKIANIAVKLKKTTWKNNIMREASELFRDKHFTNNLDNNPYLLCFKNGVIDFEKGGTFRKGKPSDYLSLCTNINYIPFDETNIKHTTIKGEIEHFFKQLFPNPDLYTYMWEHLASILLGKNLNQTFNMYTGNGRNGKSKLVEFMGSILGDYKGTVPISLVTQKRGSIGGVSPEIAALKGLRYAVMQEPSKGMVLNEGVMKELTGGDPIQGRKLFKDTVTFIPQFTLVVCTNHLFEINTDDDGTWRRIRVCDYISRFVPNPSRDSKKHEFLVDPNIDKNFHRWREIAASLLIDIARKTGGCVKDCPIVMAASQKYKAQQDYFTAFFDDRIVQCAGSECACAPKKKRDKCRMQKRDVLEVFKEWYLELYGGKIPKGKDLYEFLEKKIGQSSKGRGYQGYRLMDPNIEEEDAIEFESNSI